MCEESADQGYKLQMKFLNERKEDLGITSYQLSKIVNISQSVLNNAFRGEGNISHKNFLKICGALDIRPYLIPADMDKNEMQRMFFN